jgi:Mycothiol maleylpyruvate isomerase N-terminal domain
MPIVADTKNWTWVIERPCPECGFDASEFPDAHIGPAVLDNSLAWPAVLARPSARDRPNDSTWSPLEYAAHVRDVLAVYRERLRLMVDTDDPLYPNWDQDETAVAERYNEQDPVVVGDELGANAVNLAAALAPLTPEQWQRVGRRSDGASFTVSSMAKYMTHDLVHHRWDVNG